jgi:UDP-glucuronate 4-epimerase
VSKRVLVTGAAGFIGSNLAEALVRRGDRVVGLDNFDPYYDPATKRRNVAEVMAMLPAPRAFELVEGDIRDRELVRGLYARSGFDAVVHLAALAGVRASVGNAARYFDVNVGGTINLLDAAVEHRVPQVVLASTSSVHGDTQRLPFVEDDPCDRPLAPYPASKRSCELLGYTYHRLHGLHVTAPRFFTVYGPRNRPDMMASMLIESVVHGTPVTLYERGQLKRDWTYVSDIVDGVIAAVDKPLGYEIVNLGRGEPVLLADFVEMIESLAGRKAVLHDEPMPAADMRQNFASVDKARRLLGYEPSISVREGVARLWDWYRAHAAM